MNEETTPETVQPEQVEQPAMDAADAASIQEAELQAAALDDLKKRATTLGVKFHPSIGAEALSKKIAAALESQESQEKENEPQGVSDTTKSAEVAKSTQRSRTRDEQMALVRVRIQCMDPLKKGYDAEIFTVSNALCGTVTRTVPFNVPWHIPKILLNCLKEKQFMTTVHTKENRIPVQKKRLSPTYAIELLEPLSQQELKELAQRQAMAQGTASA